MELDQLNSELDQLKSLVLSLTTKSQDLQKLVVSQENKKNSLESSIKDTKVSHEFQLENLQN